MKMYIIIMETKFIIPEYKMKRFFWHGESLEEDGFHCK
jgi:hypothetical protein